MIASKLLAKCFTIDPLSGYKGGTINIPDIVNCENVRMIERGGSLCLTNKTRHTIGVLGVLVAKYFYGRFAVKAGVLRKVNLAHAALSYLGDNAVLGKHRARGDGGGGLIGNQQFQG